MTYKPVPLHVVIPQLEKALRLLMQDYFHHNEAPNHSIKLAARELDEVLTEAYDDQQASWKDGPHEPDRCTVGMP